MPELDVIKSFFAIGSSAGVPVALYLLWKIDRRILTLELRMKNCWFHPSKDDGAE